MNELVLSLFPGIGLLDTAFELEGFCVVRGPDLLWGGCIKTFHPPAERFEGVLGGPPCQAFTPLANVNEKRYGWRPDNLIPEFERCVLEAAPNWYVMENVPQAPIPDLASYPSHSFNLNSRQLGMSQDRTRRWTFGARGGGRVLEVDVNVFENGERERTAFRGPAWKGTKTLSFADACRLQGLESFDLPGFTVKEKTRVVCNGVPLPMGRAIAKAVRKAIA